MSIRIYIMTCFAIIFYGCIDTSYKKITKYHENGIIYSEKWIRNDSIIEGPNTIYYNNGNVQAMSIVENGVINGSIVTYYESGKLESLLNKKNTTNNDGYSYYFFENGNLKAIEYYTNDTLFYKSEFNNQGILVQEYRKLYLEPLRKNISINDTFIALIKWKGPRNFSSYEINYFDLKIKNLNNEENKSIFSAHDKLPMNIYWKHDFSKIFVEIVPIKKGNYLYWGEIIFHHKKSNKSFIQNFEGEFICE
jgi:hypothetical protein